MKVTNLSSTVLLFVSILLLSVLFTFHPSSVIITAIDTVDSGLSAPQVIAVQIDNNTTTNMITTTTPIKHLVVIYPENTAFDHYFATYPNAENLPGEPHFSALPNTPSINGLAAGLLNNNTNLVNPYRLDREDSKIVAICDNDHEYSAIQKAYNGGLLNKFVGTIYNSTSKNCNPNQP